LPPPLPLLPLLLLLLLLMLLGSPVSGCRSVALSID